MYAASGYLSDLLNRAASHITALGEAFIPAFTAASGLLRAI